VATDGAVEHHLPTCDAALSNAFGLLGKRWNGVIIGTLISGPAGFSDIRRALDGISDSVLSERLSGLAAAGIVNRNVDPGPPVGVSYELTEAGHALAPVLDQLMEWARSHL
jgi:DNA-binding HxlR family transcriptional regulator